MHDMPHTKKGKENIKKNHWSKSENREDIIKKVSKTWFKKGQHSSPKTEFKKGMIPSNKGKHYVHSGSFKKGHKVPERWKKTVAEKNRGRTTPQDIKDKISEGNMGKTKGSKHYNWRGGISFEPYGLEFDRQLKLLIRQRDNFTCQECDYTEGQLGYMFGPHHIDYDKRNNDPNNLILLCRSCNSKANFNREDWTNHFQDKLGGCFK